MKKFLPPLAIVGILFVVLVLYYGTQSEPKLIIDSPKGWEVVDAKGKADFFAKSPAENKDDIYQENVSVIKALMPEKLSLEQACKERIEAISKKFDKNKFNISKQEETAVAGEKALTYSFTYTLKEIVELKTLEYVVVKDNYAFYVSFNARNKDYAKFEKDFQAIIKTARFKK